MSTQSFGIEKPVAGETQNIELNQCDTTALQFTREDVQGMTIQDGGALVIVFIDGGQLVFTDFEQMAKSDFALRFADGEIVSANDLYETLSSSSLVKIEQPAALSTASYDIKPGAKYEMSFSEEPVSVSEENGTLLIVFDDGGRLVLQNFQDAMASSETTEITMNGEFMTLREFVDAFRMAEAMTEEDVPTEEQIQQASRSIEEDLNEIEPATGDDMASQAQQLAQLEPAAGPDGGGAAEGRGYGFQSSFDATPLNSPLAIGPIGPTQYLFEPPRVGDDVFLQERAPDGPAAPTLDFQNQVVYEDGSVLVSVSTLSNAGSTVNTTVTISGIPAGWAVDANGGTYNPATGTWTGTATGGAPFNGGPILSPPADSDADLPNLTVTATNTSTVTGLSTSVSAPLSVTTDAVADTPDVNGDDVTALEDNPANLDVAAAVTDLDGSETITQVVISNVPAGFTLSAGTETAPGSGVWVLQQSDLAGLQITAPADYYGTITLGIEATATESNKTDTDFDLTNDTATNVDEFNVTWLPVADPPSVSVAAGASKVVVKEDGSVDIPVTATINPVDSPDAFLTVTVTGIDPSWGFSAPVGTYVAATGTWTVTLTAGQNLNTVMTFTPPAESDADLTGLQVTAVATEPVTSTTASSSAPFQITVDAVADDPTIVADDDSGVEGTALDVDIAGSLGTDNFDGSESITGYQVSGVPAEITFSAGTNAGGGVWTFTPAEIAGLTATHSNVNFNGSVTMTATILTAETNTSGGEPDTSDNTNSASDPFTLTWKPDIDPPTIKVNGGVEPVVVKEDGTVDVRVEVNLSTGAEPGEYLQVVITGFDPAWGAVTNGFAGGSFSPDGTTWTATLPANTNLDTLFTFAPNAESDIDLSGLNVNATAIDPAEGTSASVNDDFDVIVDAVADAPSITADDDSGEEGDVLDVDIAGMLGTDNFDGSESITGYVISGVPSEISFSAGTNNNDGTWSFTPAQIAGLTASYSDPNFAGSVTMTATVLTAETNTSGGEPDTSDNTNSASDPFTLTWIDDDEPQLVDAKNKVDESDMNPATSVSGNISADFGSDGPGVFSGSGTYAAPALTSNNLPVTITYNAATATYTGATTAGVVFTLAIQSNGAYAFNLVDTLDHPDTSNPDDVLAISFGVQATDTDGDVGVGSVVIRVFDDGPVAYNDVNEFNPSNGDATGNVITGQNGGANAADDLSQDTDNTVTMVSFKGQDVVVDPFTGATIQGDYGELKINADGSYEYTLDPNAVSGETKYSYSINNPPGSDNGGDIKNVSMSLTDTTDAFEFSMTIDPSSNGFWVAINGGPNPKGHGGEMALLYFDATDPNNPVITAYNYNGQNGDASFMDGSSASGIQAPDKIVSSITDPGVFGSISVTTDTSGNKVFSFTMDAGVLQDHNPAYGNASDWTGLSFEDMVGIWLHPVSGLSTTYGSDGFLTQWDYNSQGWYDTSNRPTIKETITNDLKDVFEYTLTDGDGDNSVATLTLCPDSDPVITTPQKLIVDETDFNPTQTVNGTINVDYGTDAPGTITPTDASSFDYSGSVKNNVLRSDNQNVTVTLSGDTYTGTRTDGKEVFTLQINTDGTYTFVAKENLDHANDSDPDDKIFLEFGFKATDSNGDEATDTITIRWDDDGPVAVADSDTLEETQTSVTGNVMDNDDIGTDFTLDGVVEVSFNGNVVSIAAGQTVTINGNYGKLTIDSEGVYTYETNGNGDGTDVFGYMICDTDQDTARSTLTINVTPDDIPVVVTAKNNVDESDMNPATSVSGTITADFGGDGPGTFAGNGSYNGPALTSNNQPVTVSYNANTGVYTGATAAGTVFTLALQSNGAYAFNLVDTLDHPNAGNPNDVLTLNFGVRATDADGDTGIGNIQIRVFDDGPVANNDLNQFFTTDNGTTGNVVTGLNGGAGAADDLSQDMANNVTLVSFKGTDYAVNPGTGATVNGDHGVLKIYADGSYTYTLNQPVTLPTQSFALNPTSSNVSGQQESFSKGGMTISVANNGDYDLTWVNTSDGSGIGIDNLNASDSTKIWPKGEALEIAFDQDASSTTITIAEIGDNNDDGLHGVDYIVTLADGSTVTGEQQFAPSQINNGHFEFTLNAADFGQPISSVKIFSVNDGQYQGASMLLNNVTYEVQSGDLKDEFEYTLTDADGDTSTAMLVLCPEVPENLLKVGENVNDDQGSNVPHHIGGDQGVVDGGAGLDILVGDFGGATQDNQNLDYNVVMMLDVSGSMGSKSNSSSQLSLLIDAVSNLLTDFNSYQNGTVKVHLVPFSTDAHQAATFNVSTLAGLSAAISFLNNMPEDGWTNYEAALESGIDWLQNNQGDANTKTVSYFVSDGEPNYYLDNNGNVVSNSNATTSMNQIRGNDGSNEIAQINALSDEVIAVGVNIGNGILNLDEIDSNGDAINIDDANDLDGVLSATNPILQLASVGDDTLQGGSGGDIIFGDSVNTDALAQQYGLSTEPGSGWEVFDILEATSGNGWSRQDTIDYIKANKDALSSMSTNTQGDGRTGGNDTIYGGAGDDTVYGQEGDDTIYGGAGDDDLYGDSYNTTPTGGDDTIYGGDGVDFIDGGAGNDTIDGGADRDIIYGWTGDDTILGGAGDDDIVGEAGADTLTGGAGADKFWYLSAGEGGDTITDFDLGEGDSFDFSVLLSGSYNPAQDAINNFVFTKSVNGNTEVYVDANGSGNVNNAELIATLEGVNIDLNDLMNNGSIIA